MAKMPLNESSRLSSLHGLTVPGTTPEAKFEAIVQAASAVCGKSMAVVSLVDERRQWFHARSGMPDQRVLPHRMSFCVQAILQDELLEVPDTRLDERFSASPLVSGKPHIRFYAGQSLRLSDGSRVGTLCVLDTEPGTLSEVQREVLRNLAQLASLALESRRTRIELTVRQLRDDRLLQHIGTVARIGGWGLDLGSGLLELSEQACLILGVSVYCQPSLEEVSALFSPESRRVIRESIRQASSTTTGWDTELRLCRPDGQGLWVRLVGQVETYNGKAIRLLGAIQDIDQTVRQRQELEQANERITLTTELARQRELLHVTLKSIDDAVITADTDGYVSWLNPSAEKLTGWSCNEAIGKPLEQVYTIIHEKTRYRLDSPVQECLRYGKRVGESRNSVLMAQNGKEYGVEDSAAPILDTDGALRGVVLVFRDVTEQRRLSRAMTYRATHDDLTELYNRSEFESRLCQSLQSVQREPGIHALLFIDLDQFKLVNDACGHPVGDRLLKQIAGLLGQCIRDGDTLARLGGDEFGVILNDCSTRHARDIAQEICDRIDDFRFTHGSRRFRIGTSIGLVPLDSRWASMAALMQAADASCYAAKEAGRNRVHVWFDTDHAIRLQRGEMRWAARLEQSLDDGLFELHAQRLVCLGQHSERLNAEVLIRLRDDRGELTMPSAFLPAAERFHLASRIDRWVLRHSIDALLSMDDLQQVDMLWINLSGQSVGDQVFHRDAIRMLHAAGRAVSNRICLEITETAVVTNLDEAAVFIRKLKMLGVKTALDDFGSGASSFGYLRRLPVDILKIDGQFITDLIDDPLDEAAVRCFADVAAIVGLKTVAEHVHCPKILERVRTLGIDYAQGYLLHEPEPIARVLNTPAEQAGMLESS